MSSATNEDPKLSAVEHIKMESKGLEGGIPETMADPAITHFDKNDIQLIKHHGTYQQDNRDTRKALLKEKKDKEWMFMVRTKIPGGRVTAEQYLVEDELAHKYAWGSLRVTSRQGLQMHGVGKDNLKNLIKGLNNSRLTTMGACGDVNRNTMCCPVCDLDWRRSLNLHALTDKIAETFAPQSTAYWEIWCDGEKFGEPVKPNRIEPLYGENYLPRKFKMSVGVPEDNCIDIYTHDLGIEAVHDGHKVLAYDLLVGGGMGFTHNKEATYARLGSRLLRVQPEDVMEVVKTIVMIQRDHGGRADRKHARLKYLMDDMGDDWMREQIFSRTKREFPEAGPTPEYQIHDHLGWHEDHEGKLMVGIRIENGRIIDREDKPLMTGLREIVKRYKPEVRFTALQDVILVGLDPKDQNGINTMLDDHGLKHDVSSIRRRAMACPALPTCGLALTDAERAMPDLLDALEAKGSGGYQIEMRMTGCPNSCVRTGNAEVGIAGQSPGKYALYLGGSHQGNRLAYLFRQRVEWNDMPDLLHGLIQHWRNDADGDESFGDWCHRVGAEKVEALANGADNGN